MERAEQMSSRLSELQYQSSWLSFGRKSKSGVESIMSQIKNLSERDKNRLSTLLREETLSADESMKGLSQDPDSQSETGKQSGSISEPMNRFTFSDAKQLQGMPLGELLDRFMQCGNNEGRARNFLMCSWRYMISLIYHIEQKLIFPVDDETLRSNIHKIVQYIAKKDNYEVNNTNGTKWNILGIEGDQELWNWRIRELQMKLEVARMGEEDLITRILQVPLAQTVLTGKTRKGNDIKYSLPEKAENFLAAVPVPKSADLSNEGYARKRAHLFVGYTHSMLEENTQKE